MFAGHESWRTPPSRVTRNSNLYFEEKRRVSLLETIRVELHNRRKSDAVRLEIETGADPEIIERLRVNFEFEEDQVFRGKAPSTSSRLSFFYTDVQRPELKFPPFTPKPLHLGRKSAKSSTSSASTISCCTTPTTPTTRSWISSSRAPTTPPSSP